MVTPLEDLLRAIQCIHSSTSTTAQRNNAYNTCEAFKETCENLPLAGLELSKTTNSVVVRHFGYQLLEHFVKFKWTEMGDDNKTEFKRILIKNLVDDGTLNILEEATLIKNIISSLLTEILKRDWPQHWLDFFPTIKNNLDGNNTAGELLLSSVSRLIEDIELDNNLTHVRRADLLRSIGSCNENIIELLSTKLQEVLAVSQSENFTIQKATALHKIGQAALSVLCAAIPMTWFNVSSIHTKKSELCTILFLLLRDKILRQSSADVLLGLCSRKTHAVADNEQFVNFMLQDDALKMIFTISEEVCATTLNDDSVLFLKTLSRMYTQLGENHISSVFRNGLNVPKESFQKYLQLMLIFYQHPLISIRHIVVDLWVHLLNFEHLKKNTDLIMIIPHVVSATQKYFCKPLPDEAADDLFDYCEVLKTFNVLLSKMISVIDHSARLSPNETLTAAFEWQTAIISSEIPSGTLCNEGSKPFNVWKFFATFIEKIITSCMKSNLQLNITLIQENLVRLLQYTCNDPLISYWHVSTINSYVPIFKKSDSLTIPMLEKLFTLLGKQFDVVYPEVSEKTMLAMVSDLHRHTSNCLLRFVTNYPAAITWEVFQEMQTLYNTLLGTIDNNRYGSMLLILEALIAGSNKIPDLDQQVLYIKQLITPLTTFLDNPELLKHAKDPTSFLRYLKITPTSCSDTTYETKQLRLGVAALCAVAKRFKKSVEGQPKAAFIMVLPYLELIFSINKCINKFWCSEIYKDIPWLKGPLEPDKETKMIYCTLLDKRSEGATTFRLNIVALTDYCNQLVESVCEHLTEDIYKWSPFSNLLMDCYVQLLPTIQMPRLKAILHAVIKPFVVHCPLENYGIVLNILQACMEMVYKRLSEEWDQIQLRKRVVNSSEYAESSAELDEIFHDHMVLIVTREYCEMLSHFFSKKSKDKNENRRKSDTKYTINPITEHLLKNSAVSAPLLMSVFSCMAWGDGVSSNRACGMAHNAIKMLASCGIALSPEATYTFVVKALQALQIHGQHDNCLYTLLNVVIVIVQNTYQTIPNVTKDIFAQIPNVNPEKIERFFSTLEKTHASDRNLRDSLQSVVSPIINRPISEQGKQHLKIAELQPIIFKASFNGKGSASNDLEGLHSLFHPVPR